MEVNWLMRVATLAVNVVYFAISQILSLIYCKKPPSVPPITDPLLTLSAATLAKRIRQREITSHDVVWTYIERIKKVNPFINAVVDNRFTQALIEAKLCDDQLKIGKFDVETLEKKKPLFGVPVSVKECCAVKGLSHTGCTLSRKGIKATIDSTVVELLRNAGAIPLCVTNTPEMCCNFDSTNPLYGRTCNPYDARYTSGGSSGGEGALIGAGASVIGIGSDLGGSVRIPALFNGIFGHKPTANVIPINGHYPLSDDETLLKYLSIGPITRYAEDLGLIMRILSSRSDRDLRLDVPVDLRQLRVYYRRSLDKSIGAARVMPEMKRCVDRAKDHFLQHGVCALKLPIDWPVTIIEITMAAFLAIKDPPQILLDSNDPKARKNTLLEMGKALLGQSQHTMPPVLFNFLLETHFLFTQSMISRYMQQAESIRRNLMDLLGENGVLIYPTFRTTAPFPSLAFYEFVNFSYTGIFNIFGFPAVHVPMGLNREGLPIGVQVIAAPYQDRLCLAVAKELETAFGGWVPPSTSIRN